MTPAPGRTSSLRIFIPAPCFEDSFVDNVQATLQNMGHEVQTLGRVSHRTYWSLPRHALRVGMAMVAGDRPPLGERKILEVAKSFKPDIVLGLTSHLHHETLEALHEMCPDRLVLWWGDTPANNQRWGLLDPAWDAVFIKDVAAVSKLRLIRRNVFHLHEAMNPNWHRPLASQAHNRVAVAGNYYAFRQALIRRLLREGIVFDLYGPPAPRWASDEIKARHTGQYVTREQKSRVFGEALACLNTFNLSEGDSLNCRAFEIAGAGGLQLIEYRRAIEECFEPGREVLVFSSYGELVEHIERVRKYPADAKLIRQAGAKRALSEHTYSHRIHRILECLAGRSA